jgi:hypothetical protein
MKSVINSIKSIKNPFLLFLPFLILYVLIIIFFSKNTNYGDEIRYLTYARNLIHGFYSPTYPDLDLGNPPGYPILLVPFVALHLPVIFVKLMNACFYYFSIVFLYKSLEQFVPFKFSFIFSLLWAVYPSMYEQLPYALPEIFSSSLIPFLLFCLIKAFSNQTQGKTIKRYIFFAGLTIGYLALTKAIFGYVIITMLAAVGFFWILNTKNNHFKKSVALLAIAFITNIPYLIYTYNLTDKLLYWSSFGGNNLYWMSSPYEEENGSWIEYPVSPDINGRIPGTEDKIRSRHEKDFNKIIKRRGLEEEVELRGIRTKDVVTGIEQDDILKEIAIENIKSHPRKFIENCISNAGRIIFNYPYSYAYQRPSTLQRLPVNGTIMVLSLFCLIPTLFNWKKIRFSIRFVLLFTAIYLGGSILGSAETRMFTMIVPILFLWIAVILYKTVTVRLTFN